MTVEPNENESTPAASELAQIAAEVTARWGPGQLPALAGPELAERFRSQHAKLAAATEADDKPAIAKHTDAMIRAWRVLDAAVKKRLSQPDETVWHLELPTGRTIVIVRDPAMLARFDGKAWLQSEVAAVLDGIERAGWLRRRHGVDQPPATPIPDELHPGQHNANDPATPFDDDIPF